MVVYRQGRTPDPETIVVNLHCSATGWIKYATNIFAGANNDKTIVLSDDLVIKMQTDSLFLERRCPTEAKDVSGTPYEVEDLCDDLRFWLPQLGGDNERHEMHTMHTTAQTRCGYVVQAKPLVDSTHMETTGLFENSRE